MESDQSGETLSSPPAGDEAELNLWKTDATLRRIERNPSVASEREFITTSESAPVECSDDWTALLLHPAGEAMKIFNDRSDLIWCADAPLKNA